MKRKIQQSGLYRRINRDLNCSPSHALSVLKQSIGQESHTVWSIGYFGRLQFQGEIKGNYFKVRARQPHNFRWKNAYIEGKIFSQRDKSRIVAVIVVDPVATIVRLNPKLYRRIFFLHISISPFLLVSFLLFRDNRIISIIFAVYILFLFVVVFGTFNFFARRDAEELDVFIKGVFQDYM